MAAFEEKIFVFLVKVGQQLLCPPDLCLSALSQRFAWQPCRTQTGVRGRGLIRPARGGMRLAASCLVVTAARLPSLVDLTEESACCRGSGRPPSTPADSTFRLACAILVQLAPTTPFTVLQGRPPRCFWPYCQHPNTSYSSLLTKGTVAGVGGVCIKHPGQERRQSVL